MYHREMKVHAKLLVSILTILVTVSGCSNEPPAVDQIILLKNNTQKQKMITPGKKDIYVLGSEIVPNPYFDPVETHAEVYYFLVDASGNPRKFATRGWEWCGSGSIRSEEENRTFKLKEYEDQSFIRPGWYKLLVIMGSEYFDTHNNPVGTELARSELFQIVEPIE